MNERQVNNQKNKSRKEVLLFFITKVIVGLASIISISIRSSYIDPGAFGQYSIANQTVTLCISIFVAWIVESATRYYDENTGQLKTFYSTTSINWFISLVIACGILVGIGFLLPETFVKQYLFLSLCLLITMSSMQFLEAIARVAHQVLFYSISSLFIAVLNICLFLVFGQYFKVEALFLTTISIDFLFSLVAFFYFKIFKYFSFSSYSWKFSLREMKYGLPFIISWAISWIFSSSDLYVIQFLTHSDINSGVYQMSSTMSEKTISIIADAFSFSIYPTLITLWNKKCIDEINRLITKYITYYFLIGFPALVGLAAISPLLYGTVIESSYNPNGNGVFIIICLSSAFFLRGYIGIVSRYWFLEEKPLKIVLVNSIGVLLNIGFDVLFVWLYGYLFAAVTTAAIFFLLAASYTIVIRKTYHFKIEILPLLRIILSSVAMGVSVYFLGALFPHRLLFVIVIVLIGIAIYFAILLLLGGWKEAKKIWKEATIKFFKKHDEENDSKGQSNP